MTHDNQEVVTTAAISAAVILGLAVLFHVWDRIAPWVETAALCALICILPSRFIRRMLLLAIVLPVLLVLFVFIL